MLGNRFKNWISILQDCFIILNAADKAYARGCNTGDIVRTLAHAAPLHPASVGPFVAQPVVVVPPPPIAAHSGPGAHVCSNAQFATCHPAQKLERLKGSITLVAQALQQEKAKGEKTVDLEEMKQIIDLLLILHK